MPIIRLDKDTIEKIAAGEVIESPLSVVKELVENSIDANSKNITIEIRNGGKSYIRVTDDGSGIESDQLELAFKKHATSKITGFDDLYRIDSLGFRGEALPSIAAVSKLTAISKTELAPIGSKLTFYAKETNKSSIATNKGTSIIVEDLFYNMPARRKFLKSDLAESNKITKLLYAFAIGYQDISFKYIKDDRLQFRSSSNTSFKLSIADLLDSLLEENLIELSDNNDIFKIKAYISNSNYYRGNRSMQYIFANKRLIENDEINWAIEYQYQGLIPSGRYPAFFLFIDTNPKNIDVNIHPNKKIVKFSYEAELIDLITNSINKTFQKNKDIKTIRQESPKENKSLDFSDYKAILDKYSPVENLIRESPRDYSTEYSDNFFDESLPLDLGDLEDNNDFHEEVIEEKFIDDIPTYKTSLFSRYSIFEEKGKAYILDHRRADEKVRMSKYIREFKEGNIAKQVLTDPIVIELKVDDVKRVKDKVQLFENMGFDLDFITNSKLIIREMPLIFDLPENGDFFYDLLDLDYDDSNKFLYKKFRKLAKALSFRKGHTINEEEALSLYKKLMDEENPYKNYDGQATLIMIESKDLEKYFER
ncbi:DNA mismatch repair endonuclease MutL [Anaerococcus sp. NML200574]|uniref:DNA mismatch repair endonuclease MutL n=1 Tax=Anaerococcus sp. NML200574 TaxID=2954486 RepID=UPI0022388327|nr:DNA mismatch repair endonuclease MutL [Anaerococcus sp. NML200574]MCW6678063.1 DNA mismatch repair endonuclease MutL [Anaerococcus sp. NML200574]